MPYCPRLIRYRDGPLIEQQLEHSLPLVFRHRLQITAESGSRLHSSLHTGSSPYFEKPPFEMLEVVENLSLSIPAHSPGVAGDISDAELFPPQEIANCAAAC